MIISHTLRYVYIGIPRTGSKSMNRWLMDHYEGEWIGYHHDWRVPEEARDYLVFTIVRNPYEQAMSGWFHVPWSVENPEALKPVDQFAEELRKSVPLKDGTVTIPTHNVPEIGMNQTNYVKRAGVSLVLYLERIPSGLQALPFVDPNNMPPYPHVEERGKRPRGNFFDHFTSADEAVVWAHAAEDFATFGYQRYHSELPATARDVLEIKYSAVGHR